MNRITLLILTVLLTVIEGCATDKEAPSAEPVKLIFRGQDEVFSGDAIASIDAVRITEPPVLDGRLNDACWEAANPVTGFKQRGSESQARKQSVGYVVYDEENLYIGVRCLEPNPDQIKARPAEETVQPYVEDQRLFSNDSVEVMLKPDHSESRYFQFVVDVSGGTWDALRTHGGGSIDPDWNGDMTAAASIAQDHWSAELRIPFHCLELPSAVRSDWRINICRNKQSPHELSAIAREGHFNEPHKSRA